MRSFTLLAAIALIALFVGPAMASDSVQLSNERGFDTEVRGYSSGNQASNVPTDPDGIQKVATHKESRHVSRGYFTESNTPSWPKVRESIDQSRENG
jgi:hypothetical protein